MPTGISQALCEANVKLGLSQAASFVLQGAVSKNDLQTANRLLSTIKVCICSASGPKRDFILEVACHNFVCYAAQADPASCSPSAA